MKHMAAALVSSALLLVPAPSSANTDWMARIATSVVPVKTFLSETDGFLCTAFSISERLGLYLSVDHCFVGADGARAIRAEIDGQPARQISRIVFNGSVHDFPHQNATTDIIVLVSSVKRPAARLGQPPAATVAIGALGYAGTPRRLTITEGHVANPNLWVIGHTLGHLLRRAAFTIQTTVGASGGPIVDRRDGGVVGMMTGACSPHPWGPRYVCSALYGFIARLMAGLPP